MSLKRRNCEGEREREREGEGEKKGHGTRGSGREKKKKLLKIVWSQNEIIYLNAKNFKY